MCRFYDCLFACFCEHDLKIIKPCACSLERQHQSLCDIYQPAKEPIILRDLCAICAFLGRGNNAKPEVVYARYYELREFEELEKMTLQVGGGEADESAVVLKPDAFASMMRLMEVLPDVFEDDEAECEEQSGLYVDEYDDERDKENMPPTTCSKTLAFREKAV